jgi:hypothetical protein
MKTNEYIITSYMPASDIISWDVLKVLSDEEIWHMLYKLGGRSEYWVCLHDNPKDSRDIMMTLTTVARCHFGGRTSDAVEAFRYGLQDAGMDLADKLHSLLSIPDLDDRHVAMDQYISAVDVYRRLNFLAGLTVGTNNYARLSATGPSPPNSE